MPSEALNSILPLVQIKTVIINIHTMPCSAQKTSPLIHYISSFTFLCVYVCVLNLQTSSTPKDGDQASTRTEKQITTTKGIQQAT